VLFTVAKYGKVYWVGHAGVAEVGEGLGWKNCEIDQLDGQRSIRR